MNDESERKERERLAAIEEKKRQKWLEAKAEKQRIEKQKLEAKEKAKRD